MVKWLFKKIENKFYNTIFANYQDYFHIQKPSDEDYDKKILNALDINNFIKNKIEERTPFFVSRLGTSELNCLKYYNLVVKKGGPNYNFSSGVFDAMCNNAGFFPRKDKLLKKFSELYLHEIPKIDLLGIWFNPYEDVICNTYCKNAQLAELGNLDPYQHKDPWSKKLKGKKVLVIHPFAKTIESQYRNNREKLFDDKDVLPEFELITLKAVQSIAGQHTEFKTWFEALDYMKDKIKNIDFDVALIGAGAYGLPLGAFIKGLGKQAIHLGGTTQILFGIKGTRWESNYIYISKFFNEHWVRPSGDEIPKAAKSIEGGCYW